MHVTALAPLLQELVRANESYARQQGVALELRVRDDLLSVWVDRERLAQALQKLLDNAIKLSPASAPVSILAERHGGLVRIAVTDRGPGIPEEFRQFVFQKFVQVDAADIRYRAGTGMGLSLARAIVERLGGSLDYVSGAKQGTTFYLDLPEAEAAAAQGR
jgi:signal transduction histidine kinase